MPVDPRMFEVFGTLAQIASTLAQQATAPDPEPEEDEEAKLIAALRKRIYGEVGSEFHAARLAAQNAGGMGMAT